MNKNEVVELIERFQNSDLGTLEYDWGEGRLCLIRKGEGKSQSFPIHQDNPILRDNSIPQDDSIPEANPIATENSDEIETQPETVKAPLVGVFYQSDVLGGEPLVQPGDEVKQGDLLCILEAMKVMNEIRAPYDLRILNINTVDGEMVQFGQTLFEVESC